MKTNSQDNAGSDLNGLATIHVALITNDSDQCRVRRQTSPCSGATSLVRALARRVRRNPCVHCYEITDAFVAVTYDSLGKPTRAELAWPEASRESDEEKIALLREVWRAANLAAAA